MRRFVERLADRLRVEWRLRVRPPAAPEVKGAEKELRTALAKQARARRKVTRRIAVIDAQVAAIQERQGER